jgi:hypothetical protein
MSDPNSKDTLSDGPVKDILRPDLVTEKQNNLQKITTDYRSGKVLVF